MSWERHPYARKERKESSKHNRSDIEREVIDESFREYYMDSDTKYPELS